MEILNFYTLTNTKFSGMVTNIDTTRNLQKKTIFKVSLEIPHADFLKIQQNTWFNYFQEIRNDAPLDDFDSDSPIEIQLILRESLNNLLKDKSAQDILSLMQEENKDYAFLNQSESWMVFRTIQNTVLPPHLQAEGSSLRMGYNTRFAAIPTQTKSSIQDIINVYLLKRGKPFEDLSDGLFRTNIKSAGRSWVVLVAAQEEDNKCLVYSVLPTLVPQEKRGQLAKFLIHLNYDLGIGAFEMDMSDGEIRFRTSVDVSDSNFSIELLHNLFITNIRTMNIHINPLQEKII